MPMLVLGLLAVGCGGTAVITGGEERMAPTAIVLEVRDEGGFAPLEAVLGRPPRFVVQADGTVYSSGPVVAGYPGSMLPNIQKARLTPETLTGILDLVPTTGLPDFQSRHNTEASSQVADVPTTVVTYHDGNGSHTFSVYGLEFEEFISDGGAIALGDLVQTLHETVAQATPLGAHRGETVEVLVGDHRPAGDSADIRPWPLPVAPDEIASNDVGWSCTVFDGEVAADLLDTFDSATTATMWDFEGANHRLVARSLLPHEDGCAVFG